MDFGSESDIDDFLALEKEVRNEPAHQLEEFARMFKTQSPGNGDAFGDLDILGTEVSEQHQDYPQKQQISPVNNFKQDSLNGSLNYEIDNSEDNYVEKVEPVKPVILNNASKQVLKKHLNVPQPTIQQTYDNEIDMDDQLKQLEKEIQKYQNINTQLEFDKRNLQLDYQSMFRKLEADKSEFMNFKKKEQQEIKRQKTLIEESRQARLSKEKASSALEIQQKELLDQNASLKQDVKRIQSSSKQQLENVRLKYENTLKQNQELISKLEAQDKVILQLKQAQTQKNSQQHSHKVIELTSIIESLNEKISNLQQDLLKAKEVKSKPQITEKLESRSFSRQNVSVQEKVTKTIGQIANQSVQVENFKKVNNAQIIKQKPAHIKITKPTPSLIDPKNFQNLPFFTCQDLFKQFNSDVENFIDSSPIQSTKVLTDREEFLYSSGAKRFIFKNGTEKIMLPNGSTDIQFDNGDIKRVENGTGGQVSTYYYADVGTLFTQLQTTQGVVKVYRFQNDQMEKHFEDGRKIVYYPDGTMKYVYSDGTEKAIFPDGEVVYN